MLVRFTKNRPEAPADTLTCVRPDGSTTTREMPRQGILPRDAAVRGGTTARLGRTPTSERSPAAVRWPNLPQQRVQPPRPRRPPPKVRAPPANAPRSWNACKANNGAARRTPRRSRLNCAPPAAATASSRPPCPMPRLRTCARRCVSLAPPGVHSRRAIGLNARIREVVTARC